MMILSIGVPRSRRRAAAYEHGRSSDGFLDGAERTLVIVSEQRLSYDAVSVAANRRRFYLERASRRNTRGSGSDLGRLMQGRRPKVSLVTSAVFGDIAVMLAGAHAANAYAPPRATADVDFLVPHERFSAAEKRLRAAGWRKSRDLVFPNAKLALYGSAWHEPVGRMDADIMASPQTWVHAAFAATPALDQNGARVLPLPYLVLMKLDSARGIDQGDLARMLGRLDDVAVECVVNIVEQHYDDHQAAEDVRQYARIGRWEYQTTAETRNANDDERDYSDDA